MLELLHAAERDLPRLLVSRDGWRSYKLDQRPPRIDRMLREYRDGKLLLHRIHTCAPGAASLHCHPWPSAMRLVEGTYELVLGYGAGERPPAVAARLIANGGFEYEMTAPDAWHSVRAIGTPAMTIMVTGPRWTRSATCESPPPAARDDGPVSPLSEAEIATMLECFRSRTPGAPR